MDLFYVNNGCLSLGLSFGITMRPVVQLERTGCGIASVAAIAGLSYGSAKMIARHNTKIVLSINDVYSVCRIRGGRYGGSIG